MTEKPKLKLREDISKFLPKTIQPIDFVAPLELGECVAAFRLHENWRNPRKTSWGQEGFKVHLTQIDEITFDFRVVRTTGVRTTARGYLKAWEEGTTRIISKTNTRWILWWIILTSGLILPCFPLFFSLLFTPNPTRTPLIDLIFIFIASLPFIIFSSAWFETRRQRKILLQFITEALSGS